MRQPPFSKISQFFLYQIQWQSSRISELTLRNPQSTKPLSWRRKERTTSSVSTPSSHNKHALPLHSPPGTKPSRASEPKTFNCTTPITHTSDNTILSTKAIFNNNRPSSDTAQSNTHLPQHSTAMALKSWPKMVMQATDMDRA